MKIANNAVVSIEYTLTNDEGDVVDTSQGRDPLGYIHGIGNLVPGLERELEGKAVGDAFQVSIPPEEAYGIQDADLIQVVPKSVFEWIESLEVGIQIHMKSENSSQIVTVIAIAADTVTIDGNHPMAGETLNFDVSVVDIREATKEELEHGHAHGPGGAHH